MLLPDFPRYLSLKPQEIEDLLNKEELKGAFWYLKMLEDLEFSYYSLGNYRKCMELAERLKETLPEYVIPPRHVAMIYYDNADMTMVEKKIDEALTFATENDLKEDIHMLYTAKSLVYAYRGEYKQSIEYSTLSLASVGKGDSYEKYFTIMERVWQHAKIGEHKYAQALANAYLAYTRAKAPEYVQFMASALAYTLYKMGRTELAYQLAKETIQLGANRSIAWLMSMGIATNHLLSRGELQDIDSLLSNLIRASHTHGMKMLIVDYANDVFAPILGYAQERNVEPEIIEEIMHAVRIKDGDKHVSADVKLKMFGNVSITAGGQEIQWKTRKSKDLFMHYVLAGKVGMDRSVILDLLWKDYLYESAINNLKTTNNIIRKTLDNYGIEYKLHYINSRYSITIENLDNEYERYRMLIENFNKENDYLHKAELMDQILKIYRADLCVDVNYPDFEHERTSVKQELIINMIKLIRGLAKAGEYVESKRFLNALMLIDGDNDYNHMVYELDRFINLTK
jgi:tetratricopeptide (TPR) repeat protein